jgi:DNA polymerase-3 subunit gamma/tau
VPDAVSNGLIEVAEDHGERLRAQAATLGPAELTRAADTVADGLLDMRGATAPRLQLELICAKVLLPGADDSTQGVHARLDRIERRMTLGTIDVEQGLAPAPPTAQVSAPVDIPPPPSRVETPSPSPVETPSPESSRASARKAVARPPAPSEPVEADGAAATELPSGGTGGQIGLADVRRLWPDILQRVRERKKVTWVMLSQNAQVLAMDDTTLTIGLSHAGVRDNFVRSGHDDILREAMRDELLVDRRIEAVVDPSTGGGSASPAAPPAAPAPPESSWDQPPDAAQSPPPADPPPSGPTASAEPPPEAGAATPKATRPSKARNGQASKRRAAVAAAQAERSAPPEPSPDIVDDVGEDDVLLEDDSRSHTELLGQVLGAKVIDEQPNS